MVHFQYGSQHGDNTYDIHVLLNVFLVFPKLMPVYGHHVSNKAMSVIGTG